jgi:hypothetical protein
MSWDGRKYINFNFNQTGKSLNEKIEVHAFMLYVRTLMCENYEKIAFYIKEVNIYAHT